MSRFCISYYNLFLTHSPRVGSISSSSLQSGSNLLISCFTFPSFLDSHALRILSAICPRFALKTCTTWTFWNSRRSNSSKIWKQRKTQFLSISIKLYISFYFYVHYHIHCEGKLFTVLKAVLHITMLVCHLFFRNKSEFTNNFLCHGNYIYWQCFKLAVYSPLVVWD